MPNVFLEFILPPAMAMSVTASLMILTRRQSFGRLKIIALAGNNQKAVDLITRKHGFVHISIYDTVRDLGEELRYTDGKLLVTDLLTQNDLRRLKTLSSDFASVDVGGSKKRYIFCDHLVTEDEIDWKIDKIIETLNE